MKNRPAPTYAEFAVTWPLHRGGGFKDYANDKPLLNERAEIIPAPNWLKKILLVMYGMLKKLNTPNYVFDFTNWCVSRETLIFQRRVFAWNDQMQFLLSSITRTVNDTCKKLWLETMPFTDRSIKRCIPNELLVVSSIGPHFDCLNNGSPSNQAPSVNRHASSANYSSCSWCLTLGSVWLDLYNEECLWVATDGHSLLNDH